MKRHLYLLAPAIGLVLVFATSLFAQEWDPASGKIIPGSESPNRQFAFFEIFREPTTAECVCIADSVRTRVLSLIHCNTEYATNKPYKAFLTILWDKSSQSVAVHDGLAKHSKVCVYLFDGQKFVQAKLPDFYGESVTTLRLAPSSIKSSGQMPLEWNSKRELVVEQRLVTSDGKSFKRTITIRPSMP